MALLLAAATLVPIALGWLGIRILQQDRAVERSLAHYETLETLGEGGMGGVTLDIRVPNTGEVLGRGCLDPLGIRNRVSARPSSA
jgi:hypothetical protein